MQDLLEPTHEIVITGWHLAAGVVAYSLLETGLASVALVVMT